MTDPSSPKRERPLKKTELLEVRLDAETKRDFLAACRQAGRTASDVVREAIRDFVEEQQRPLPQPQDKGSLVTMIPGPLRRKRYLATAAAAVAGVTLFAAMPSAASPDLRSAFDRLDANSDGTLDYAEYSGFALEGYTYMRNATSTRRPELKPGDMAFRAPDVKSPAADMAGPEHVETRQQDFVRADRDADAAVTYLEFETRYLAMLQAGFDMLDENGDGRLAGGEARKILSDKTFMRMLDGDDDGRLTFTEYTSGR